MFHASEFRFFVTGISFAKESTWPVHRKFTIRTFKNLQPIILEDLVREEARRLVSKLSWFAGSGTAFCNKNLFRNAVGNVICSALFGESFVRGDSNAFFDQMNEVYNIFEVAGVLNILPWLRIFPKIRRSFSRLCEVLDTAGDFISKIFEDHWHSSGEENLIRNYTDAFIAARQKEALVNTSDKHFTGKLTL